MREGERERKGRRERGERGVGVNGEGERRGGILADVTFSLMSICETANTLMNHSAYETPG